MASSCCMALQAPCCNAILQSVSKASIGNFSKFPTGFSIAVSNPSSISLSTLMPYEGCRTVRYSAPIMSQGFDRFKVPNPSKKVQPKAPKKSGSVKLPGSEMQSEQSRRSNLSPPGLGQFRPPPLPIPGMPSGPLTENHSDYDELDIAAAANRLGELIEQVRDSRGTWQQTAVALKELQQEHGMTAEDLYGATFVSPERQTLLAVAAQVFNSLEGQPEDAYSESEVEILYEFRTLSANQRQMAAAYVREHDLDALGARELTRAIKEHERRPLGREGFSTAPGDCLGFMLHRAAGEEKDKEARASFVARGLSVVATDSARGRFREFEV